MGCEIRQAIAEVQQGRDEVRETLIKQYLPFILKVTSRSCNRYVQMGVDDEVNVALLAFNEALDKYDSEKGASFFTFAQAVINRRMIDYFRKNKDTNREIPWSSLLDEGTEQEEAAYRLERLTWEKARSTYYDEEIRSLRREEIIEYQKELQAYGISFNDLVQFSPKHRDARTAAYQVARLVAESEEYCHYLQIKKNLPLKELERKAKVSRKTMERQRKYIIALAIILMGRFYFLAEYLEGLRGD